MFESTLIGGNEPPHIVDEESAVRVVFKSQETAQPFRQFIAEEGKASRVLDVDHLLVLRYLLSHPEVDTATAAELCQRRDAEMRDVLGEIVQVFDYLQRGGAGRGTWWRMKSALHRRLEGLGHAERDQRIDWDVAKTRVLSMLKQRARRGEPGLTNAGIREVTAYSRLQVNRLLRTRNRRCATQRPWPRCTLDLRARTESGRQKHMTQPHKFFAATLVANSNGGSR